MVEFHTKLKCPECGYEWVYDYNPLNPLDIHNPNVGGVGGPRKYVSIKCPSCGKESPQNLFADQFFTDEEWDKHLKREEKLERLRSHFSFKKKDE